MFNSLQIELIERHQGQHHEHKREKAQDAQLKLDDQRDKNQAHMNEMEVFSSIVVALKV